MLPPPRLRSPGQLATTRRAPAAITLQACAVAHQGEVAALRAAFAFVALELGFGGLLAPGLRPHPLRLPDAHGRLPQALSRANDHVARELRPDPLEDA